MPLPTAVAKTLESLDIKPSVYPRHFCDDDIIARWLHEVVAAFENAGISHCWWPDAAIHLLPEGQLRRVMEGIRSARTDGKNWNWENFKGDMKREAKKIAHASIFTRFCDNHPMLALTAGVSLATAGHAIANMGRFGSASPIAAALQSSMYGTYAYPWLPGAKGLAMTAVPTAAPAFTRGVPGVGGGVTFVAKAVSQYASRARSKL
ncbi:hypothetical protein SERLA73DRAFT_173636 [Serpula lacrymans var. lacrymans S7.3]|uniref:Uncharacterized protein n=2 Tax=Serpula lacrymans var. lacrymans TaxID=341189 RepID=F8PF93_SERL3|nr:uncharacterized protein SERLADRAFT_454430 [Serpula lacrymans var. lacrymans S7.9]EGO04199.1 hypothetical protein SERLA73DRAFT_173636 [Serpula lacrymans var. lacrymans S7.3]EGO30141.1 hypothetical protein SERLADRAFT_454430 [Serpula lacrymans var. lacrymans S7.9]